MFGFPFYNRSFGRVSAKPVFGTGNDLIEWFGVLVALELGLAFAVAHPEDSVIGVRIDYLVGDALLLHECQGMDNGQKLTDVVGAVHRAIVKHPCPCSQVYALVLHWSRVSRAGCVYSPGVGLHFGGEGKNGVVAVRRRVGRYGGHGWW